MQLFNRLPAAQTRRDTEPGAAQRNPFADQLRDGRAAALGVCLLALLTGCGSGAKKAAPPAPTTRGKGAVELTLLLPAYEPSRMIPGVTQYIDLAFKVGTTPLEIPNKAGSPPLTPDVTVTEVNGITVKGLSNNTVVRLERTTAAATLLHLRIPVPAADGIQATATANAYGKTLSSVASSTFNLGNGETYTEDKNGNGNLDPGEDANNNGTLDNSIILDLVSRVLALDIVQDLDFTADPLPTSAAGITGITVNVGELKKVEAIGRPTTNASETDIVPITASRVTWSNLPASPTKVTLATSGASNTGLELKITGKKSTYVNGTNTAASITPTVTYNEGTGATNKTVPVSQALAISVLPTLTPGAASATTIDQSGNGAANASTATIDVTLSGAFANGTGKDASNNPVGDTSPDAVGVIAEVTHDGNPANALATVTRTAYNSGTDVATYRVTFTAPVATALPNTIDGTYAIVLKAKDAPTLVNNASSPINIVVNAATLADITGPDTVKKGLTGTYATTITGIKGAAVTWDRSTSGISPPGEANANAGSIAQTGIYTAPSTTGKVRIIAEVKFGSTTIRSKEKTITVTD